MAFDGFPPFINAQLHYLVNHFPEKIKVDNVWSGTKFYPGSLDRFTLRIPYCLDTIKWDVIYNVNFPLAAPDVIFGPEDDDFHRFLMIGEGDRDSKSRAENVLGDWNNGDPTRLLTLVQELRNQYMSYQRTCAEKVDDARLKFEISTIVPREGIEILISSGPADKPEEVKFAVPLMNMNINRMVHGCPWRHPLKIYLQVIFPVAKKYASTPPPPRLKLISPPELKSMFSIDDVKLPPWLGGMCMAEYLPNLEELLEKQVSESVTLIGVRRSFIEALAPVFGRPLEADQVFCRKATFLATTGTFAFLVHFLIPTQFPKQHPVLILQSTQHFQSHGVPIKSPPLSDYPWSPRWEIPLMAERIFEFLVDEAVNFKRFCAESQQQH